MTDLTEDAAALTANPQEENAPREEGEAPLLAPRAGDNPEGPRVLATPQKTEPEEPSPDPRAEERDEAAAWTDTRKRFIESLAGVAFTTYTLTDFAGLRDYALSVPVSTATRNCPALLSSPGGRVEGLLDSRAAAAVVTVKGAVADEVTGTLAVVDDPESLDVLAFGVPGGPLHRLDEQGARQLLIA